MSPINQPILALANELAQKYLSGNVDHLEAIEGKGEVNQIYKITDGDQRVILRVNTPGEYERFLKEEWCAHAASNQGVPTPAVLCIGQNGDYAYMLLDYIAGNNGQDINATPDFWLAMGTYLRKIHQIPVQGFGEKLEDITTDTRDSWGTYLSDNIQALSTASSLAASGTLTVKQSEKLVNLLTNLRTKKFAFGLSHGDYSPANAIVDESGSITIIDWGSAEVHVVPHYDLGVILDESLQEDGTLFASLLKGYGLSEQEYEVIKEDIAALQILEAVDKLRWAIDKAPHRIQHYKDQVKKFIPKLT